MEGITTVGIDLAKRVFLVHAIDAETDLGFKARVRLGGLAGIVEPAVPERVNDNETAGL